MGSRPFLWLDGRGPFSSAVAYTEMTVNRKHNNLGGPVSAALWLSILLLFTIYIFASITK
jgi:hypothetical protein